MFDARQLILDLDAIMLTWPELAEDEELRQHVLTKGTDFHAALTICLEEMRHAETLADAIQDRVRTLYERGKRLTRKADAMRALMQRLMEHAKEQKVVLPEATLSLRNMPPKVIIEDEAALPDLCMIITKSPNKTFIKEQINSGIQIPGASLSNGGVGLTVRCK